jgi:hypothetical protein
MARLPSTRYLMQLIGPYAVLFEDYTEREIVRFDPSDRAAAEQAQEVIDGSELTDEDKVYAHLWSGYFAYYAGHGVCGRVDNLVTYDREAAQVVVGKDGQEEVVRFDPSDQDATARAQKAVYDSALSTGDKWYAYFSAGYWYAKMAA